jgi:hypothetical protein
MIQPQSIVASKKPARPLWKDNVAQGKFWLIAPRARRGRKTGGLSWGPVFAVPYA